MTLLIYDDIYLNHSCGAWHPERPERLDSIMAGLKAAGLLGKLRRLPPRRATKDELALVHTVDYIAEVETISSRGGWLDIDTCVGKGSWEVACAAVGGVLVACDGALNGPDSTAFCAVRPPGHHATPSRGMGFCLFNSVAIAAKYVQKQHGLGKVAIVDWDVHHGNGTSDVFYEDPTVLYVSLHRYPFYPGTGASGETGAGEGKGATLNVPLPASTSREEYRVYFMEAIEDALIPFAPEMIFISAGFDAYTDDPVGGLCLEPEDFGWMTERVSEAARESARGRVVSVLEGGYDLASLGALVSEHVAALLRGEKECR